MRFHGLSLRRTRKIGVPYHVRFSVHSPCFTAWTMKLICPKIGGSFRYRSMPSGGRIASDGSSGWLRSSSKFLAGTETCRTRQMRSEEFLNGLLIINLNPPSTCVGICLQGDRSLLLKPFGVRTLWVGAVHLRRRLWSRRNRMEDPLRSSRRVVMCASWWIWPSRCRLHRAGLELENGLVPTVLISGEDVINSLIRTSSSIPDATWPRHSFLSGHSVFHLINTVPNTQFITGRLHCADFMVMHGLPPLLSSHTRLFHHKRGLIVGQILQ